MPIVEENLPSQGAEEKITQDLCKRWKLGFKAESPRMPNQGVK
jgi:hypothetical protein